MQTSDVNTVVTVFSDEQGERSAEGWRELEPQRRGAGPDERRGSENEQCSSHYVAGRTEWIVRVFSFFFHSALLYVTELKQKKTLCLNRCTCCDSSVYVHSSVAQWKKCLHSIKLKDSVLGIV